MGDGLDLQQIEAEFGRLVEPGPVGVAVSGGGDSIALLALAQRAGLPVQAATVDHGLRPAAKDEARAVAHFCAERAIPHAILGIGALPARGNLPAKLRDARYGALIGWAGEHGIGQILLGHTMDDQAETVLMRLARGSGTVGLAGMYDRRVSADIAWLRPLLWTRRADLRCWLEANAIQWFDDPTNEDEAFDRIKARRALDCLAPLGITVDRLARSTSTFKRQAEVLSDASEQLHDLAARPAAQGGIYLDRPALRRAREDAALRVLGGALVEIGGGPYMPRMEGLQRLLAEIVDHGSFRRTLNHCLIESVPNTDHVVIMPEPAASETP
ncbi:MAG: tRNA lysidine(34) synthetase TilS [Pseudomonadota bacterium]